MSIRQADGRNSPVWAKILNQLGKNSQLAGQKFPAVWNMHERIPTETRTHQPALDVFRAANTFTNP